jgi:hypothetical protein
MITKIILLLGLCCSPAFALTPAQIGTSPATIQANFAGVIVNNLRANPGVAASMGNYELARLSTLLPQSTGVALVNALTPKLTAPQLTRLASGFGFFTVGTAVSLYATPVVQNAYFTMRQPVALHESLASLQSALPVAAPTLDYTLYEVYLDYLTTGLSEASALAMTAQFAGTYLTGSFVVGYEVGTSTYFLIQNLSPGAAETLDDFVGEIADSVADYYNQFTLTTSPEGSDQMPTLEF